VRRGARGDRCHSGTDSLDEVSDEELSNIHGKLIAFGFLNFSILGRSEGIGYELTRLGRRGVIPADLLISGTFPLEKVGEAFESAASGNGLKVIVEP